LSRHPADFGPIWPLKKSPTIFRAVSIWPGAVRRDGDSAMRFMILVKASKQSEAGIMPPDEMLKMMADYHEQLAILPL
jgi:hypothetical protein